MTPFNELTSQQQKELVQFNNNETSLLYSKIDNIVKDKGKITYMGNTYSLTPTTLELVEEGLINFELYKLSTSAEKMEQLLRDKLEHLAENQLKDSLEIVNYKLELLASTVDGVRAQANYCENTAEASLESYHNINAIAEQINPSAINQLINHKISELNSIKSDTKESLTEFNKLILGLKSLYN